MDHVSAPPRLPELLLPAGSLESGLAAFEHGADAVYLGFSEFSARKQARNFSREDYRRLLLRARSGGKRIYVALNTLILEEEYPRLLDLLLFLEDFPPDAIIFQDWGLARLLREAFPSLPLHASTQTAVQGPEGARLLAELGISRLVLPRETGLLELTELREALPGLELEVFVHGALCYSYSGLCLASGLLLGRSGNRGECAQPCRAWYESGSSARAGRTAAGGDAAAGKGGRGYHFSLRDLALHERLPELIRAGVASLKVEGRMKSPEYVAAVARLYRRRLASIAEGRPLGAEELGRLEREAALAFARPSTAAYLRHHAGADMVSADFPGHRGLRLGQVLQTKPREGLVAVRLEEDLGLRDGVMALLPGAGGILEPLAFSVRRIVEPRSGRELSMARAGGLVELEVPRPLAVGQELRLISSRALDLRTSKPEAHPPAQRSLPCRLSLIPEGEGGRLVLLPDPAFGLPPIEDSESLPLEAAATPGGFARALAILAESGGRDFRFVVEFEAGAAFAGLRIADLFAPPSLLKQARNRLYAAAEPLLAARLEERREEAESRYRSLARSGAEIAAGLAPAPPRSSLTFSRPGLALGLPFALSRDLVEEGGLPERDGRLWLPLAPLVHDLPGYEQAVSARVAAELGRGRRLVLGLGALHHIALYRSLRTLPGAEEGLEAFLDIHAYVASPAALAAWAGLLPGLRCAYAWLEATLDIPGCGSVDEAFAAPLFVSKACQLRHRAGEGHCLSPCPRRGSHRLNSGGRGYLVYTEDCISYLFLES